MNKETHGRKGLFGAMVPRGQGFITIMAGSVAADKSGDPVTAERASYSASGQQRGRTWDGWRLLVSQRHTTSNKATSPNPSKTVTN